VGCDAVAVGVVGVTDVDVVVPVCGTVPAGQGVAVFPNPPTVVEFEPPTVVFDPPTVVPVLFAPGDVPGIAVVFMPGVWPGVVPEAVPGVTLGVAAPGTAVAPGVGVVVCEPVAVGAVGDVVVLMVGVAVV
jgi:hypothetical protein